MYIAQETGSQMVLKKSGIGTIVFAFVFASMGAFAFLAADQKVLLARIVGGLFVVAGILMITAAKFITITIDKTQNQLLNAEKSLFKTKTATTDLRLVKQVSLEEFVSTRPGNSGRSTQASYSIVFNLQDGQDIRIVAGGSSGSVSIGGIPIGSFFSGKNKYSELGKRIASFIGVEFAEHRAPTAGEILHGLAEAISSRKPFDEKSFIESLTSAQTIQNKQKPEAQTPPPLNLN